MVTRGEIWWYDHPTQQRRPYLIITRSAAIPVLNQVLAVPATRTVRGIPTEVPLGKGDGMPESCVLTLDNMTLIRPSLCTERIMTLSADHMREVCQALEVATGC